MQEKVGVAYSILRMIGMPLDISSYETQDMLEKLVKRAYVLGKSDGISESNNEKTIIDYYNHYKD